MRLSRDDSAPEPPRGMLYAVTLPEFRAVYALRAKPEGVRRIVSSVRAFLWRQGVKSPGDVTAVAIQRHLAQLQEAGRLPKTLRSHRAAICLFCRHLVLAGLLPANPCRDVPNPRLARQPPLWLDPGEVAMALAIARERGIWPEVALALATGLRVGEMARLRWDDIDLARRTLTVRKSKSGRCRVVPLSALGIDALTEQRATTGHLGTIFSGRRTCRGKAWLVDEPRSSRIWQRLIQPARAASPKFHVGPIRRTGHGWHLLRHTAASRWVQAGVSLKKVAAWLGHASVQTTEIYAHLAEGYDRDVERGQGEMP